MATDLQRLIVSLEARTKQFENALNKAMGVANQRARSIETRFARMNSRIGNTMAGIGRGWIAGLAAGIGVRELKQLSDAATRIDNSLKVVGLSGAELERIYGRLRQSAMNNFAPLETLATLYSRIGLAQKSLGVSNEEMLNFTDKVALALRVQGTTSQEARGALIQLTQAIGSGVVRAEEFNSIVEGAPTILRAAAAGLKEAGGSVAELRKLVIDGKISSEAFFRAFEAGAPMLEGMVENAEVTIGQALENMRTALVDAAREFNASTGAAQNFADGINAAAQAISDFDVSGFLQKIEEAHETLTNFLNELGNAQVFKDLNIALGVTDESGNLLNLDAKAAKDEAASLEREVELLQATIAKNTELGFDNSEAIARLNEVLGKLAQVRASMANLPTLQQVEPVTGRDLSGKPFQVGTPGDPNALASQTVRVPAKVTPVSTADFAAPTKRGGGGGGGRKGRESPFARETEQIKERTEALRAETAAMAGINPLIDDYGFAVEKASASQELLNAAKEAGLAITPQLKAQIDALATGYASASAEAEKLAESQDRAREIADEFSGLAKDVFGGFIKDLRDGKTASEALESALGKVADKLLDIGLNMLFGGFGGGGGIGGAIASIFAAKDGGVAAHGKELKRFRRGGVSRNAAIFGEAGPEAAVPLPDGRRIPVDLRVPNVQPKAPSGQNVHVTVGVAADGNGNLMPFVRSVAQSEAGRSTAALGKQVPRMVVDTSHRQQVRRGRP